MHQVALVSLLWFGFGVKRVSVKEERGTWCSSPEPRGWASSSGTGLDDSWGSGPHVPGRGCHCVQAFCVLDLGNFIVIFMFLVLVSFPFPIFDQFYFLKENFRWLSSAGSPLDWHCLIFSWTYSYPGSRSHRQDDPMHHILQADAWATKGGWGRSGRGLRGVCKDIRLRC